MMETLFNLVLWGVPGAMTFALVGIPFGSLTRLLAQVHGKVPEATPWLALRHGAVNGGIFFAVLGFFAGAIVGRTGPSLEEGLFSLSAVFLALMALAFLATAFALSAYFCGWLGFRASGVLMAAFIGLGFGAVYAENEGFSRSLTALVLLTTGSAILALLVVLRLRSPAGDQMFEPWSEVTAERHHLDSHIRFRSDD